MRRVCRLVKSKRLFVVVVVVFPFPLRDADAIQPVVVDPSVLPQVPPIPTMPKGQPVSPALRENLIDLLYPHDDSSPHIHVRDCNFASLPDLNPIRICFYAAPLQRRLVRVSPRGCELRHLALLCTPL
jgi:hypothetical protein